MEDLFKRLLYVSDPLMLQAVAPKRLKERKRLPIHSNILPLLKNPDQGERTEPDTVSSFIIWQHEEKIIRENEEEYGIIEPLDDIEEPHENDIVILEKSFQELDISLESVKAGPSNQTVKAQSGDARKMSKRKLVPDVTRKNLWTSSDDSMDSDVDSKQKQPVRKARKLV